MRVQVNLLPEAKLSKQRNKAKRRTFTAFTVLLSAIVLTVIALLFMLRIFLLGTAATAENKIKDLSTEIDKSKELEEKASTLQQNLASFYGLNASRTYSSRIITNFFKAVPENITISSIAIAEKGKVTVTGTTGSFADVSRFASALEQYNLDYLPQADLDRQAVFKDVAINSVSKDQDKTNFSITFIADGSVLKNQRKQ